MISSPQCRSPNRNIQTIATFVKILENKGYVGRTERGKSYEYYPARSQRRVRQDGCFFDIELLLRRVVGPNGFFLLPGEKTFRYKKPNKSSPSSGKPDIKPTSHERDRPIHPRNSRLQRHTVRRIPAVSAQLHGVPRSTALPHGVAPRGGSHSLAPIPVWPGKVIYATAGTPAKTTFTAPSVSAAAFDYEAAIWIVYGCGVLLLLSSMFRQALLIRRLRRHSTQERIGRIVLVRPTAQIASFSFFRTIYISRSVAEKDIAAIFAHEKSHVIHRHSPRTDRYGEP